MAGHQAHHVRAALAPAGQGTDPGYTGSPLHVLVLTDRDWTHPQGGGTGTHLYGHVSRWLAAGHRVTVIAGSYAGAQAKEQIDALTIHRMGGRITVFPRAIWKVRAVSCQTPTWPSR